MRQRGARAALVVCLVAGLPVTALAQTEPPYDSNVEVQLFDYAVGPKTFFAVDDGTIAAAKQIAVDMMVTFLTNPVTIWNVAPDDTTIEDTRTQVVKSVVAGQIAAAYGLTDRYQLNVALPITFSESGDGIDVMTAGKGTGLQISGTGDLRAEVKARIFDKGSTRLAGAAGLTLPSSFGSGGNDYLGDNWPTARARIAYQWTSSDGKLSAGADAGFILRKPRTIYASKIGEQLTFGVAASYAVTDKFALVAETFGRTGLDSIAAVDSSPMEAGGGLRVRATNSVAIVLGGDAGLLRGIGSPDYRFFASVGYLPDTRDSDGDGVANNKDKCPLVAEDFDGFQDRDGCPDDDNDGDLRADGEDKCPLQAEDIDGFDDDDGCPDLDNDQDGIPDLEDHYCPMDKEDGKPPQPKDGCPYDMRDSDNDGIMDPLDQCFDQEEDQDGFDDWDGCPDSDNDHDGVADDDDKCPLCAEDKDGLQDEDGCPDNDVDADGVADTQDKCAAEPETVNGIEDWDGCPDDGGAVVADFDGDRITFAAPVSFDKKGLTKAGQVILDQAALLMLQHPEVTTWAVAVTARKDGDLRKHSQAVVRHLVGRGVPVGVLHILSEQGDDAVGIGVEDRVEEGAEQPFACPAGMEAQPKARGPGGATPADAGFTDAKKPPAGDDELEIEADAEPAVEPAVDQPVAEEPEPPSLAVVAPAADADGDGVGDAADKCPGEKETANGYLDDDGCKDDIPKALKAFTGVVKGINFKTGSAEISKKSFKVLDKAVKALSAFPDVRIEIAGHTDDVGKRGANIALSQSRAESVMQYLVDHGIPADHVTAHGYGPDRPLVPKKTKAARAKNRRVEFHVLSGDAVTATP